MENRGGTLPFQLSPFSTKQDSKFRNEVFEVYNVVNNPIPVQITNAEFQSDDPHQTATPGGHSFSIDLEVLKKEETDSALAAITFAKLGMAINESFIS